jgi:AraC-like DNA-binding protein
MMRDCDTPNLDVPSVPVRAAKSMIESAKRFGITPAALLADTGLQPDRLAIPAARISYGCFLKMYRNLIAHPLPSDYGFQREPFSIASYGMLGYAMMSSATLQQAIQIALRYYRTAGPLFELSFGLDDARLVITVDDVFDLGTPLRRLVTEDLFTSFPPLLALLVGKAIDPEIVELDYPEPPHAARYASTFNCPVRFDAPLSRFVLGSAALALPLLSADADSAVLFERSCRELLAEIERHASLANELRQLLLASPGKLPDAAAAASRLHIGERTLRRRLAVERTSYQQVLDEVRSRIAIDYLMTTHLSTQEIAMLLGFSEATNFRRAFVRWTRRTPSSYRKGY